MNPITTQISEIKKSMPKHVLWLVLFAAFLVVVILLVLLMTKKSSKTPDAPPSELILATDPVEIDWTDVPAGEKQTRQIKITANDFALIPEVGLSEAVDGLMITTTCVNMGEIGPEVPCSADLTWTPANGQAPAGTKVLIKYHLADAPETMAKTAEVPVALSTQKEAPAPAAGSESAAAGATASKPEPKPAPAVDSEPEPDFDSEPDFNPVLDAVETLAPPITQPSLPSVSSSVAPKSEPSVKIEPCYEFAFGGYDTYGKQIGWIRPQGGRYMFHPFSDKNCSSPTGEYNSNTGFITDLKNPGKKIGSDSEHIGFIASGAAVPALSNPVEALPDNRARQSAAPVDAPGGAKRLSEINTGFAYKPESNLVPSSAEAGDAFVSTDPYDRTFVLRQYKPIPATIVNEVRADAQTERQTVLPVQATVDRHVYSDNGRTIIIPTGTLMLGYLTGDMPGPYKAIGRMQIKWYRFVRPDGVEFSFGSDEPFAGDSQGRVGVPGHGSTDYLEQFIMPMITAVVPAAVNMIAPISDKFINQIDLNNNTVTQSGQVRSSELAKNEIITAWNKVAQKLMVDMMDNTVPPFSIAAGTRITVYSPKDLVVNFCDKVNGVENCNLTPSAYVSHKASAANVNPSDPSWIGQVRSFDMDQFCGQNGTVTGSPQAISQAGYDYRTVVAWCQASQYQAMNMARQQAVFDNQQAKGFAAQNMGNVASTQQTGNAGSQQYFQGNTAYNEQVLGLKYNDEGIIKNPFVKEAPPPAPPGLTCEDGTPPDASGCCTGEVFTDMGDQGWNCCPSGGGDCFPPLT